MSHTKTVFSLAIAMLIASAFLVVAQDRIDVAAVTPDAITQIPGSSLNSAIGSTQEPVEATLGPADLEPKPYNTIDGVPLFGVFQRVPGP
jgi:hypothetical protein